MSTRYIPLASALLCGKASIWEPTESHDKEHGQVVWDKSCITGSGFATLLPTLTLDCAVLLL